MIDLSIFVIPCPHASINFTETSSLANSIASRLLSVQIQSKILLPIRTHLPSALASLRTALFPDNALGPARIPPASPEEVQAIKRACATAIVSVVPPPVRTRFFGTEDQGAMVGDVEATLDLLGDQWLNKALLMSFVECVVGRLFPEIVGEGDEDDA